MRKFFSGLILALFVCAAAQAVSLDEARQKGYVAEMPNGYIKAQPGAPADIDALVKDINGRRHDAYQKIAEKHGITAEQVGAESYRKRMKSE